MTQKKSFMRTGFNFLFILLFLAVFHYGQSEQLKPDQDEGNNLLKDPSIPSHQELALAENPAVLGHLGAV